MYIHDLCETELFIACYFIQGHLYNEKGWDDMQYVTLNNGVRMPQLGFGVYKIPQDTIVAATKSALGAGYRSIDTAQYYENEHGVGEAIRTSGVAREDLFITTKVWNSHQGYKKTLNAFEDSLQKLGLDYIDMYMVHWPAPEHDLYIETYEALEKLYKDGRVRAIGVCNFEIEHLERLLDTCEIPPVVNQIECHPYLQQNEIKAFCKEKDIFIESWGPLRRGGSLFEEKVIRDLANKHNKTPAQIILRWHLQEHSIAIPKSVTPSRIKENMNVFNFSLSEDDMVDITTLDREERMGKHPNEMNIME